MSPSVFDWQDKAMSLDERPRPEAFTAEPNLLLVLPVCLARHSDELQFELQACNGMERWLENFSRIEAICPILSADEVRQAHSTVWKPVSEIANGDRVKFVPLPYATSLGLFARAYFQGRSEIRRAIARSRYLCFAIGGLFGDWGAIACLEARRLGRPYAVWTDRVEHKVGLFSLSGANPIARIKEQVRSRSMYFLERRCIRHAALGLFHGASCYAEYAPWCPNSYVVHDVHAKVSDAITSDQLNEKCRQIAAGRPLRITYVGRADEMKGPLEWLDVLDLAKKQGLSFTARWLGDGPLLGEMRRRVTERGLDHMVCLPGFVADRAEILAGLRESHVFLFCHKTPESPRNLVEALVSGCPIVGYRSDFAEELAEGGGGEFVPVGDRQALAERLCRLAADRSELVALARGAAESGKRFNDVAVFQHRSNLIKAHL